VDGNAVDRGYRALSRRPRPGERESEYAVPRACFGAALDELRQWVDARRTVPGVVRVRFGPAEEAWLAMGQGRETCYLTATVPRGQPFEPLFEALDAVAARYDGRPHWGREYGLRAAALRGRYPRFDDARAVRELVDPFRRFLNPHLQMVFGS
jgi:L-gulonolactone oxidase